MKKNIVKIVLALSILIAVSPEVSWSAFRVYLNNGRVMTGIDTVEKGEGVVRVHDDGVTIELDEDSVLRVEEYEETEKADGEDTVRERPLGEGRSMEPAPETPERTDAVRERERERHRLTERYRAVTEELVRIDTLEKKSRELEGQIYRSLRRLSPRDARQARKEKAEVDAELKEIIDKKKELQKERDDLEDILDITPENTGTGDGETVPAVKDREGRNETEDERSPLEDLIVTEQGKAVNPQLQTLRKQDEAGSMPEQFRPYKDFLERQQAQ